MRFIDLTGKTFGRLYVLAPSDRRDSKKKLHWLCRCSCGKELDVLGASLRSGNTRSCGCIHREQLQQRNFKHGRAHTRLHRVWAAMRERCYNTNTRYKPWHGRGIKVCAAWDDYAVFEQWALSNGYAIGLTIDRIDVNGDYTPDNCRWVTVQQQSWNKTVTRYFEYRGERKCLAEWAKIYGINKPTLYNRVYNLHWDIAKAIEEPVKKRI